MCAVVDTRSGWTAYVLQSVGRACFKCFVRVIVVDVFVRVYIFARGSPRLPAVVEKRETPQLHCIYCIVRTCYLTQKLG